MTGIPSDFPSSLTASGNFKVAINEVKEKTITTLLDEVTTNQTSAAFPFGAGRKFLQATITGTGAVSGTITWYGTNTNSASGGVLLATMSLTGTTTDTAGADIPSEPKYIYCVLADITGTGATVTATVGI